MYLFNRMIVTNGDMEAVMPVVQEVAAVMQNEAGIPFNVWAGGNGFVTGTIAFSVAYESLAARAEVTAKLAASKAWWAAGRNLRALANSVEPDTLYRYIQGGTLGAGIPLGTVVTQNQFQLAQGADWIAFVNWALEYAELCKKITDIETHVLSTYYGKMGELTLLTGLPNAAAVDQRSAKLMASAVAMPKFLACTKYALAGTVMQRQLVKIA
jgi:hypothetical protein